jgi:CNT family concentrative nucleoside transporter
VEILTEGKAAIMVLLQQGQGLVGITLILLLAWGVSEDRKAFPGWKWIAGALLMQIGMALVFVRVPFVWHIVGIINNGVEAIERATLAGSSYMFGYLGGGPFPSH